MGFAVSAAQSQEPQAGHARGSSDGQREQQPRVPIIGVDSGAIPGTKPQPGCSGAALDRAARDILRGHLRRTRRKDHKRA